MVLAVARRVAALVPEAALQVVQPAVVQPQAVLALLPAEQPRQAALQPQVQLQPLRRLPLAWWLLAWPQWLWWLRRWRRRPIPFIKTPQRLQVQAPTPPWL